jgi:hypothetical protein
MLSADFMPARWRGTTNTDGAEIGVSFECGDGAVARLSLPVADARHLAESILDYLGRTSSHSPMSSGMSSLAVSPQDGVKV